MTPEARARAVVEAAARLVDRDDPLGARARTELPSATGLSPEGVELALCEHVERSASDDEWRSLVASTEPAQGAWVSLSANVFVGAVRALALAFATAPRVWLKPSRREPAFARLVATALGEGPLAGALQLVDALDPVAGDVVHAYGADETIAAIGAALPAGVRLVGHGHGLGVAVIGRGARDAAALLAADVVPFDQRGCVSPRIAFVEGDDQQTLAFAEELADALHAADLRVPIGEVSPTELAAVREYLDVSAMACASFGRVGVALDGVVRVPPVPRVVHVVPARDVAAQVGPIARWVTAIGGAGDVAKQLATAAPGARVGPLGRMQRPPLDGPIDRRGLQVPPARPTLRVTAWRGSRRSTSRPSPAGALPSAPALPTATTSARTRTSRIGPRARRSRGSNQSSSRWRPRCGHGRRWRRTVCSDSP